MPKSIPLPLLACCLALAIAAKSDGSDLRVLGIVEDFDKMPAGVFQAGFFESHRWTDEQRQQAKAWSRLEIVPTPDKGNSKALRIQIHDERVLADGAKLAVRLAPFYPPEGDALRIRLRVVSGHAAIYIGGPTAYYGNSDVFTEPQTLRATATQDWVEVVCNFNHPTWRNYRRSGFSTDAPRNYYNRWAQEPVGIFLVPGSKGEVLIDSIELLALGEGKPFATFTPAHIQPVRTIADFEDGKRDGVFNLYMSAAESEWFEESWKRTKRLRFEPMQLTVIEAGLDGKRSLECRGRTAEEVHATGVQTTGVSGANAIAITLSVDAPAQSNSLVGAGKIVPVDFLVFTAPAEGKPFPWQSLAPSDELRAHGGPGFDYQLTHRLIAARTDLHFAIYQTRRYLKPGEWSKQVLPIADFTCVYGQGSMRGRFLQHEPLRSEEVIAVSWLHPWCRSRGRDEPVVARIDTLSFVHVPGSPEEHRSFWQVPDVNRLLRREENSPGLRKQHIWLPGDTIPPAGEIK